MKFFTKKINQFLIIFLSFLILISCGKDELISSITDISKHININAYRYHSPYRFEIYTKDNNQVSLLTSDETSNFKIKIVGLSKRSDAIINAVGGNEFKITSDGTNNNVKFGISNEEPNSDRIDPITGASYPIVIIIEDTRSPKKYLTGYKYAYLGTEGNLGEIILLPATDPDSDQKYEQKQVNIGNNIINATYFGGGMNIEFPVGTMKDKEGEILSSISDNSFLTQVTYLNTDINDNESIHNLSPFPIPTIADNFLDKDGINLGFRIAEFKKTDYIGLDIIHQRTNKEVTTIDKDLTITFSPTTAVDTFNVWRFYEDPNNDGVFNWERVDASLSSDSSGQITFKSPLSIGWAISSSPPVPTCGTERNTLYGTVHMDFISKTDAKLNDLYKGKLFQGSEESPGEVVFSGETVLIYDAPADFNNPITITLKIFRKRLNGEIDENHIFETDFDGCGQEKTGDINAGIVTKFEVDIKNAYCDNQPISLEKTAEIDVIEDDGTSPDIFDERWKRAGYLNDGKLITYLLEHEKSYWIKIRTPGYSHIPDVMSIRAIKLETDGIKPVNNNNNNNNNNGRLVCSLKGAINNQNRGYECVYKINTDPDKDKHIPIDSLYNSSDKYCELLIF